MEKTEILKICTSNKDNLVVSIHCDKENPDGHLTGFLHRVVDDFLLVKHISPHGLYDGYILVRTEQVNKIEYGGAYESRCERLYTLRQQAHKCFQTDGDLCTAMLNFAIENNLLASFEGEDFIHTGIICQMDKKSQTVTVKEIDDYGIPGDFISVSIPKTHLIAIDSDNEQDALLLNTNPT